MAAMRGRVVATGEVVRGILLTGDELLRVEKLTVRTRADLIDHRRLQVDEDAARHVLAGTRLGEERVEGIITATDRLVARHLTVRLNTVLQAEELPATVPDLAAGLTESAAQHRFADHVKAAQVFLCVFTLIVFTCLYLLFMSLPHFITCT